MDGLFAAWNAMAFTSQLTCLAVLTVLFVGVIVYDKLNGKGSK